MLTTNQINLLTDEELGYLVLCLNTEWKAQNMGYELKFDYIKYFKTDAIYYSLNKYKTTLKEEHQNIVDLIINKLEANR